MHETNVCNFLHEFDMNIRVSTFEGDFQSLPDSFAVMQCNMSVIKEAFNGGLERILLELEETVERAKVPAEKTGQIKQHLLKRESSGVQ
jgi:hypothetical protein